MVEFRDALTGLIDEYGQEAADQPELPPSHSVGNRRTKQFFLDVGQNHRGVFLRITEQTRNFRSAINIPENMWEELADYLKTTSEQMDDYYQQVGKEKPKSDYAHSPDGHEQGEEELADERRRTDDSDDHENAVQQ